MVVIDGPLYLSLKELSKEAGVTLNAILQYVWHKVLHIYGNSSQTVVGVTVSGRNIPIDNIERSVGLYINTLPLIVNHNDLKEKSVIEAIVYIQESINEINSRSVISLGKLQKGGRRLFDSLFIYENYPTSTNESHHKLLHIASESVVEKPDYPLEIIAYEVNNQLWFKIDYAGELFNKQSIVDITAVVKKLLEQIVSYPNQAVKTLSYLCDEQHHRLVKAWNATDRAYPSDKTMQILFEEQVERVPENLAVICEERKITYRALNARANRLAHYLIQHHEIKPDSLVALCLDRSEYMLIAILAVLKAGGAYVPIDPSYPDERIAYILTDTSVNVILGNEIYNQRFTQLTDSSLPNQVTYLSIDSLAFQNSHLANHSTANPLTSTTSDNLAYIIYTSGTTGEPKGVMQSHCNVVRLFTATEPWYQFNRTDIWVLFHSYVFDFSIWEIWGALAYGGTLVIPSHDQIRDLYKFYELCRQQQVTVLNQTPAAFYQFSDIVINKNIKGKRDLACLRYIILGGDRLNLVQLENWVNAYGCNKPKLINMYGITETTVHATYKSIVKDDLGSISFIGKAIPDLRIYVLDDNLNPLPIGAIGELYIGGMGLARGYLNKPALTREKFITNPFQSSTEKVLCKNDRLYKTGDLVRWLSDGNLEYIGRNDFQVKVRGYRIELGEIENALYNCTGVKQSLVLIKEHKGHNGNTTGNKYLVAYYVSDDKLNEEAIIGYLQSILPEYMIPTFLVYLEQFPLTINGKLDSKALPEPDFTDNNNYIGPRNELEEKLCKIWSEVLDFPKEKKIGIHDDFFRLGGNSILIIKFANKLIKEFQYTIHLSEIFQANTIDKLTKVIIQGHKKEGQEYEF